MAIRTVQLGVGLLHQTRPHLPPVGKEVVLLAVQQEVSQLVVTLDKEELPVDGGKEVVHDDIYPGAILPELEVEDASIALTLKSLQIL